jgi:UDP-3-O-[3-hydroxymyristoyl] glucosamine N-acyltransferase
MRERRFFDRPSALTIAQIISLTGAEPRDATGLERLIADVAPLDQAGPADLTFIESNKYGSPSRLRRRAQGTLPQAPAGRAGPSDLT